MSTGNPPDRNNDPISEDGSEDYQLGRAELGEDTSGPHQMEFHVELKKDADWLKHRS